MNLAYLARMPPVRVRTFLDFEAMEAEEILEASLLSLSLFALAVGSLAAELCRCFMVAAKVGLMRFDSGSALETLFGIDSSSSEPSWASCNRWLRYDLEFAIPFRSFLVVRSEERCGGS